MLAGLGRARKQDLSLVFQGIRERQNKCSGVRLLNTLFFRAFAVSIFIAGTPASAPQAQTIINIRNAGGTVCATFLNSVRGEQNTANESAFLQWAAAYSTAFSRERSLIDAFPIIDTKELVVMTALVCLEEDGARFEVALRTALLRLEPFWIRRSPEILTLNDPSGRSVEFFAEATRALQETLNEFGAGIPVDGQYGNQTGNAIKRLNEARGSTPWLTPDGEFLYQLTKP